MDRHHQYVQRRHVRRVRQKKADGLKWFHLDVELSPREEGEERNLKDGGRRFPSHLGVLQTHWKMLVRFDMGWFQNNKRGSWSLGDYLIPPLPVDHEQAHREHHQVHQRQKEEKKKMMKKMMKYR